MYFIGIDPINNSSKAVIMQTKIIPHPDFTQEIYVFEDYIYKIIPYKKAKDLFFTAILEVYSSYKGQKPMLVQDYDMIEYNDSMVIYLIQVGKVTHIIEYNNTPTN